MCVCVCVCVLEREVSVHDTHIREISVCERERESMTEIDGDRKAKRHEQRQRHLDGRKQTGRQDPHLNT